MLSATGARALHAGQTAADDHGTGATRHLRAGARPARGTGRLLDLLPRLLKIETRRGAHADSAVDATRGRPLLYLLGTAALAALLMSGIAAANYGLAPLSYSAAAQARVAEILAGGGNYAVFDLNLDMRELRRQHIARLDAAPDVVVLGASHWQEAHGELLPGRRFYNAHVHRDYYEDLLAVVEMLLRHDRLPKTLIMSIRDMTFLPVERRTDRLWLTALPDYRAMAARLGIASHPWFETWPARRWFNLLSLPAMWDNALRWLTADRWPGPVRARALPTMDVLQADGSIGWSHAHRARFTPEHARTEVRIAVAARHDRAPAIDPAAVTAVDRLLGLLKERGVRVVLIHPPFQPEFYDQIKNSTYGAGLQQVAAITTRLAKAHGATAVGSFDPDVAGCTPSMFIDAEHSGPACLQRVLDQVPGL
jgi:hypothetical protein